jgi:hypothetical protein
LDGPQEQLSSGRVFVVGNNASNLQNVELSGGLGRATASDFVESLLVRSLRNIEEAEQFFS